MSLTSVWEPEISARVKDQAERLGIPSEQLIRQAVEEKLELLETDSDGHDTARRHPRSGRTLAEALRPYIGCVDSSRDLGQPSRLSEDEDGFGAYLEEKRRNGHL